MEMALYEPGLGYYCSGTQKFGAAGDFVTAPELSPLFAQALAVQFAEIMRSSAPRIIECGGGSGALATQLLPALEQAGIEVERYAILELSGELRQRQRERLALSEHPVLERVEWLDAMPERFTGVVFGNEVLDAMPVHLLVWRRSGVFELGVSLDRAGRFAWCERPAAGLLLDSARSVPVAQDSFPYVSEIGLAARAWVASWAERLELGALLLIDYGFPRHEYYHAERMNGTLMCHYRHYAHDDPFHLPGLNDITSHVDFTAVAEAGCDAGLRLLGYTSQAQFLLSCGLADILCEYNPDSPDYLRLARGAQTLLSPSEMGELFKVMALGKGIEARLIGFARGDRSHAL
jgi:SAM-dependent MidA family methyltransferase